MKIGTGKWMATVVLFGFFQVATAIPGPILIASTSSAGIQGFWDVDDPKVSADGRFVVFRAYDGALVSGDTNGADDIFRKNVETGQIILVSTSSTGQLGNAEADSCVISADGRFVAFRSQADNLVPGGTPGTSDIYRKDLLTGEIARVSSSFLGVQGNGHSSSPAISADGRYVAFESAADNLVAGDSNFAYDVFRKDLATGQIVRVSTSALGVQSNSQSCYPSISAYGRYVAFDSDSTNLVPGDNNGYSEVFRKDLDTGQIVRLATSSLGVASTGWSGWTAMSANGRYVAFEAVSTNLVSGSANEKTAIFWKDVNSGLIVRTSSSSSGEQGNENSTRPAISADGRYVAFESYATNLVSGDTNGVRDIFRKDLATGQTLLASASELGELGDGSSEEPTLSADGRYIAFLSESTNLAPEDANSFLIDAFRKDIGRGPGENRLIDAALLRTDARRARSVHLRLRFARPLDQFGTVVVFRGSSANLSTPTLQLVQSKLSEVLIPIPELQAAATAWVEFDAMGQVHRASLKR